MPSLDRIEVHGFKSIRKVDLQLRTLNVLIGANGAGKSNFISLFKLLNNIIENNLQLFVGRSGGADAFLHYGQRVTDEMLIKLHFGQNGYEIKLVPSKNDTLIFSEESCWFQGSGYKTPYVDYLGSGHKETKLNGEIKRPRSTISGHVLDSLKSWKVYHFHDTSDQAEVKKTGDIGDNRALRPNASNLAAFLYFLSERHPQYYKRIVSTIRLVAPFFDDFVLGPSRLNPDKIQLEWRELNSDAYFNAHSLSDGTLRFICLATLLLQPHLPTTVLIDEPELGLHPYAITMLANLLQSAATKTQVIVSTQSVPLVNQFSPEDIVVVNRGEEQSTFRRLNANNMEDWLEEYGLGDLWEKNLLGGRPQKT